jgi:NAD(P)H-flavin reductase
MSSAVHPLAPIPARVARAHRETADVVTLDLVPDGEVLPSPAPGQFCMLYEYGVGEVPISVSGCPDDEGALRHTVRIAGAVTRALCALAIGDPIGVRGPYGTRWPVEAPHGRDLLVVAGGIGIAPLRPAVRHVLHTASWRRVAVAVGARRPEDLLFRDELPAWVDAGADVAVTVDAATPGWQGEVGVVTELLGRLMPDPSHTVAMVCGPEVMMRFAVRDLLLAGVAADAIFVSLERNMQCAVGHCGHCQLGPSFICLDGPVLPWTTAGRLLEVRRW